MKENVIVQMKEVCLNKNYSGLISTPTFIDFPSSSSQHSIFFYLETAPGRFLWQVKCGNYLGVASTNLFYILNKTSTYFSSSYFKGPELRSRVITAILFFINLIAIFICLQIFSGLTSWILNLKNAKLKNEYATKRLSNTLIFCGNR